MAAQKQGILESNIKVSRVYSPYEYSLWANANE
jgi:hypothetical protein